MGRLKDVSSFLIVEDDISWELGTDVAPKYHGDDTTLLLGLTDSRAAEMMKEEHQNQLSVNLGQVLGNSDSSLEHREHPQDSIRDRRLGGH